MLSKIQKISLFFSLFILIAVAVSLRTNEHANADIPGLPAGTIACTCVTSNSQTCASYSPTPYSTFGVTIPVVNSCDKNTNVYNVATELPYNIFGIASQSAGNMSSAFILGTGATYAQCSNGCGAVSIPNGTLYNGTNDMPYVSDIPYAYAIVYDRSGAFNAVAQNMQNSKFAIPAAFSSLPVTSNAAAVIGTNTAVPCRTQTISGTLRITGYRYYAAYEWDGYPGDETSSFWNRYNFSCY